MTGIFSQDIKGRFVQNFINDVANSSSNYFVTFGKFFPWPDDNNPPATNSSVYATQFGVNKELLFGKQISPTDITYIAQKNVWTSGTVYDFFDSSDPNLYSETYYVITSLNRVYKCLFNNYGAPSTFEPSLTVTSGDFNTPDGYKWKYLYSINAAQANKFVSDSFIPIIPSSVVSQFAENGAIHVITVGQSGNSYISANGYIDSPISNTLFKIANTNASTIGGSYTGSTFYIYSGTSSGSLSVINNYVVNSTGKYVSTANPILGISSTSLYSISPQVVIQGDGYGAQAVSNVDPTTGEITSVTVINRGLNYTVANTSFSGNAYFGTGATCSAIISPPGGHGSNVVSELGCNSVGISISTALADNFPSWAYYRQIGLIANPIASANLALFNGATFNQMLNFGVIRYSSILQPGEQITGFSSKASATVLNMNSTSMFVYYDSGTFQPFETVVSSTTGKTCIISTINNKDLIPDSATVYYYKNIQPIFRSDIRSEDVKLYFNF